MHVYGSFGNRLLRGLDSGICADDAAVRLLNASNWIVRCGKSNVVGGSF